MTCFVARRPNNHNHTIGKKSDGLEALLTMVPSGVLYRDRGPAKTIAASASLNPSLAKRNLMFYLINVIFAPLNAPSFNCSMR